MNTELSSYVPVIVRYLIVSLASILAARGWIDGDQNAIISQSADIITGALIALGTVAWALKKRPSRKALQAAKAIDANIPPAVPVTLQTNTSIPDVTIPGKPA